MDPDARAALRALNRETGAFDPSRPGKTAQDTLDPAAYARARIRLEKGRKASTRQTWGDAQVANAVLLDPEVPVSNSDRLKAVELAGKAAGAFVTRLDVTVAPAMEFRGFVGLDRAAAQVALPPAVAASLDDIPCDP